MDLWHCPWNISCLFLFVFISSHYFSWLYTRSKTHKRRKECFLIGQNRTKHAHFQGSPQATYNIKTEKQTINSAYLGHFLLFLPTSHIPCSFCQPHTSNWHKISWIYCNLFFVFMLYIAWKRGLPPKFACFDQFHLIKKCSFTLSCALDLFSECWQSTLFQMCVCVCVRVYTNLLYFFVCSHLACEDDCGEVAHLLIDHGARLDIQNNASVIFLSLLYGLQPCHCHNSLPFWLWLLIGRMYLVRWNLY